jgi:Spy/CpxP family protein refolding chaperone
MKNTMLSVVRLFQFQAVACYTLGPLGRPTMRIHSIRFLPMAAAAFLIASLALPAFAQGRPRQQRDGGFPPGLPEARLVKDKAQQLGIGEETLKKIEELGKEHREGEERLRAQILEATKKVAKLLEQGRPDEKAVLAAAAVQSEFARETRLLRLTLTLKIRALLTDEQLAKFMAMRTKVLGAQRARGGQRPRR